MRSSGAVSMIETLTGGRVWSLGTSGVLRRGITVLRAGGLGGRGTGTFALARIGCTRVSTNPGRKKIINFLQKIIK